VKEGTLWATSRKINGQMQVTSLRDFQAFQGDIGNCDGTLTEGSCGPSGYPEERRFDRDHQRYRQPFPERTERPA
jgi:hypothetical protein